MENVFLQFVYNNHMIITRIIRYTCTSDRQMDSAWSSSSQPVSTALKFDNRRLDNTLEFVNSY